MSRHLAVAGLCVAMSFSLVQPTPCLAEESEAELNGKPISQWVQQLRSDNRGLQVRAARALAEAPEHLRPVILPKVVPLLKSDRENDRFVAAQVLGEYGPMARSAVPDLLPLLEGTQFERNRAAAAKALGQILKDSPPSDEINKVTDALIAVFNDKYEDVRREAVTACGMIGPAAKACIPHLAERLKEPPGAQPNRVSVAAAETCERMGPLAREHVDLLIAIMHRYASCYTPAYVLALGAIGPVQDNIVPNIMDKMEQTDQSIWWQMAPYEVFERFGPKAAPAVELLDRFLRENKLSPPQVVQTMKTLRAIGPEARKALATVEAYSKLKQYNQRYGRAATAEELAEITKQAAATLEALSDRKSGTEAVHIK